MEQQVLRDEDIVREEATAAAPEAKEPAEELSAARVSAADYGD